jgi:maleylacetate reductase
MEPFEFVGLPSRAIFGAGKIATLKDEIEALGASRALFCCSPGRTDMVEKLATTLGPLNAGLCDLALPFTPFEAAEEGRQAARESNADCLVSYGGGNAVGFAKAIALEVDIPIIAIPTTLSGSETTALQGIIKDGKRVQNASPRMQAKTVIYDAELTLALPMTVLIPSGMNSMAHAVGALVADNGNPMSRLFAEEGIRAMATALKRIAAEPDDLNARSQAFYGAWLNANTLKLAPGGVNVHHKLCHTIGGGLGLSHAEVHTVILPHSTAYNRDAVPEGMKTIASALGDPSGDAAGGLFDLETEIGAPTALRDIGVPRDRLDEITDQVATDSYYSNPRPIERDGIRDLLENAWHGHRPR